MSSSPPSTGIRWPSSPRANASAPPVTFASRAFSRRVKTKPSTSSTLIAAPMPTSTVRRIARTGPSATRSSTETTATSPSCSGTRAAETSTRRPAIAR